VLRSIWLTGGDEWDNRDVQIHDISGPWGNSGPDMSPALNIKTSFVQAIVQELHQPYSLDLRATSFSKQSLASLKVSRNVNKPLTIVPRLFGHYQPLMQRRHVIILCSHYHEQACRSKLEPAQRNETIPDKNETLIQKASASASPLEDSHGCPHFRFGGFGPDQ
jgi:hypothetical protein